MGGHFDLESKKEELNSLRNLTLDPDFYNDIKKSTETNIKISNIEKLINEYESILNECNDDIELSDLVTEEEYNKLSTIINEYELNTFLNSEYDHLNCYLEIHAGAGGTEAMDWVSMLLRMYERFCEIDGYKYEEIDSQEGEEAGLKSVMIKITGPNAFGYLKNESGVHRLVRISPFDSNKRRHTSFASVTVTPVFDKIEDVEIDEKDLKIDVFHSSGAGGQSVNTSNSAVRITHLPTKIVVSVQNERSQLKNKEIAMEILQSKLYAIKLAEREDALSAFKKGDSINFGSQIRSYVLEPYKMVKDHRTDFESTDPEGILDGEIKDMLEYNLRNLK